MIAGPTLKEPSSLVALAATSWANAIEDIRNTAMPVRNILNETIILTSPYIPSFIELCKMRQFQA